MRHLIQAFLSVLLFASVSEAQYTLRIVDARTRQAIIPRQTVINTTDLPQISAELVVSVKKAAAIQRVEFFLDQALTNTATTVPYTLYPSTAGSYTGKALTSGAHSIEAHIYIQGKTAYTRRRIQVKAFTAASTVMDGSGLQLIAIDPLSGRELTTIASAGSVDTSTLSKNKVALALRIGASTGPFRSVSFSLLKPDGKSYKRRSSRAPFSVFGGSNFKFSGKTLSSGRYTLSYIASPNSGTATKTGSFTVDIDGAASTGTTGTTTTGTTTPQTPSNNPVQPLSENGFADWPSGTATEVATINTTVGMPVHLNAIEQTSPLYVDGSDTQRHLIEYEWDLGDTTARYRYLKGFNVAHLFDSAGTYHITLFSKDRSGNVLGFKSAKIIVQPASRVTLFASSSGRDSNSGTSADSPFLTIKRAAEAAAAQNNPQGYNILLKKGDSFNLSESVLIATNNTVLSSYGSGAQPRLVRINPALSPMIALKDNVGNLVVRDLLFTSNQESNPEKAGATRVLNPNSTNSNLALVGCTLKSVADGVNMEFNPTKMLVKDNIVPDVLSLRAYFVWGGGSDLVIIGNTAVNSTREHIYRQGGVNRVLLAYNNFANFKGDSIDIGKSNFNLQTCDSVYVYANTTNEGPSGVGPLGGADGTKNPNSASNYVVFDSNLFMNGNLNVSPNSHYIRLVNNILKEGVLYVQTHDFTKCTNGTFPSSGCAYPNRDLQDVVIENNTFYSNDKPYQCLHFSAATLANTVRYNNNLCVAPNLETGGAAGALLYIDGTNLKSFSEFTNNILPVPKKISWVENAYYYIWQSWSDARGYITQDEFTKRCTAQVGRCTGNQVRSVALDSNLAPPQTITAGARR